MKKYLKALLLSLATVTLVFALSIVCHTSVIVDVGKCGDNVTYTLYDDGLMKIEGIGIPYSDGIDIKSEIKKVKISSGVTAIAYGQFDSCTNLASVEIPDTVKSIGDNAFAMCESLTSVEIPDSVTEIGNSAFFGCDNLASVSFGSSIEHIGAFAFGYCASLKSVVLPDGIRDIGDAAFFCCTDLKSLDMPNSLAYTGTNAFSYCTGLEDITIPQSVFDSGYNNVFEKCKKIKNIKFSEGTTKIPAGALANSVTDSVYSSQGDCDTLISVTVPSSVKSIGNGAFEERHNLSEVVIGDGVEFIDSNAFSGCDGLNYIFYAGSKSEWEGMTVNTGNEPLYGDSVLIHYNSDSHTPCKASCTEATVCTVCGYEIAPPRGNHSFTNYISNGDATCTRDGTKNSVCDYCDIVSTVTDVGSRLGHDLVYHPGKDPTCTTDGYITYATCTRHDYSTYEVIPALGHEFSDKWTIDKEPTETEKGEKSHHCIRCDERKSITEIERLTFKDIKATAWYFDSVSFAVSRGLFTGTGGGMFDPDTQMSRGMLVTVLWRMEGSPQPQGTATFTDLWQSWYRDAALWAAENGIVDGTGYRTFSPDIPITREQMAKMIMSYAVYKGYDTSRSTSLAFFPDSGDVSLWATNSMSWAVSEGLINGSDYRLLPKNSATRAEVATILMRFIKKYE